MTNKKMSKQKQKKLKTLEYTLGIKRPSFKK